MHKIITSIHRKKYDLNVMENKLVDDEGMKNNCYVGDVLWEIVINI